MLEIKNLQKSFDGIQVIKNINLTLNDGEFVSFLGPSGCGKTTCLRMIAGFEQQDSGSILYNGKSLDGIPSYKRNLNTLFQNYALFPHMNVFENVAYGLRAAGVKKNEVNQRVAEALEMVKLTGFEKRYPAEMSGGQRQRVAIARAIINRPPLLLLDEPLTALDAKLRIEMRHELRSLQKKLGITFIYVTHDQEEALVMSDRIVVMNGGVIEQFGTPKEIYYHPATKFVSSFIGETNLFDAEVVDCVPHKDSSGNDDYMATLSVPELGKQAPLATDTAAEAALDRYMQVTDYDFTQKGQKVAFTIRPEKIRITLEPPNTNGRTDINVFKGIVEEPIYSGFQSKFYVKLDTGKIIKVYKQHTDYMDDGPVIQWKDEVYVSWSAEDAYIVEDIEK